MTRRDAMQIILKEDLRNYNLNEERSNKENEVTIKEYNDKWIVYATDERASKIAGSEVVFEVESDAWFNFIKRLRTLKIFRE
ncbi:MAG: hypothetical protein J1E64_11540 [Acetatifactor sp.]|nr:hypothetical protein [Acetatifactor sp.]